MWGVVTRFLARLAPSPAAPEYLALPAPSATRSSVTVKEEAEEEVETDAGSDEPGAACVDAGEAAAARVALTHLVGLASCRRALRQYVQEPAHALSARRAPGELWHVLQRPQVLALHGLRGSGKATLTRLACHAAAPFATLHWIADATALERVVCAQEAARAQFARQTAAAQRAARETPPRCQRVYVLAAPLVARSFEHRALLVRLLAVLRDAVHTPGSAWRGLRPRLLVLVANAQIGELTEELRDGIERWVYARPPDRAARTALLAAHVARVAAALDPQAEAARVPDAVIDDLARAYAWWTPAELADEVARCTERLLASDEPATLETLAARLAAWPNHDGRLKVRQRQAKERWISLETRYGSPDSALDPPADAPPAPCKRACPADATSPPARPAKQARTASPTRGYVVPGDPVRLDWDATAASARNEQTIQLTPNFGFA